VLQGDEINRTRIATVICVPLTAISGGPMLPGDVLLTSWVTSLPEDSVANLSQVFTADRAALINRVSKLPRAEFELILAGLDLVLGRKLSSDVQP
jgi:mRNA interferase MazF